MNTIGLSTRSVRFLVLIVTRVCFPEYLIAAALVVQIRHIDLSFAGYLFSVLTSPLSDSLGQWVTCLPLACTGDVGSVQQFYLRLTTAIT